MNVSMLLNSALEELLEHIRPVLVLVHHGRWGAGAGVLAGKDQVLTNLHVVGRARSVQVVLHDDTYCNAHVIASDPRVDLALLQLPVNGHGAAVFSSATPRPGELVYAFGHPWGQRNVLTGGVLSAVTSVRGRHGEVPILRADVQLAPGNSGGPLLNAAGEVIGLNAMIFGGDQSVAIPSSLIRSFLAEARKDTLPEGVL
jgi:serine protease Do